MLAERERSDADGIGGAAQLELCATQRDEGECKDDVDGIIDCADGFERGQHHVRWGCAGSDGPLGFQTPPVFEGEGRSGSGDGFVSEAEYGGVGILRSRGGKKCIGKCAKEHCDDHRHSNRDVDGRSGDIAGKYHRQVCER